MIPDQTLADYLNRHFHAPDPEWFTIYKQRATTDEAFYAQADSLMDRALELLASTQRPQLRRLYEELPRSGKLRAALLISAGLYEGII